MAAKAPYFKEGAKHDNSTNTRAYAKNVMSATSLRIAGGFCASCFPLFADDEGTLHGPGQPRPQAYTRYASEPSYQPEAWNRARSSRSACRVTSHSIIAEDDWEWGWVLGWKRQLCAQEIWSLEWIRLVYQNVLRTLTLDSPTNTVFRAMSFPNNAI